MIPNLRERHFFVKENCPPYCAGYINGTENPKEAAARELYEETGYVCKVLNNLGPGRIMMNRINARIFSFFGADATKDPNFEGKEDIEIVLVTSEKLKELVLAGEFEQFTGLALLVLTDWTLGNQFISLNT